MTVLRTAVPDFALGNPMYAGAEVALYEVDADGAATTTLATIYADPISTDTLPNPFNLDGYGKNVSPLYLEVPVVATIVSARFPEFTTGVIQVRGVWKGNWITATRYNSGDIVANAADSTTIYVAANDYVSGASIAADITAGNLVLLISYSIGSFTTDTTIDAADYLPFYDSSATTNKKITLTNFLASALRLVAAGSAAAPSIAASADTDTGIAWNIGGANTISLVGAGAEIFQFVGVASAVNLAKATAAITGGNVTLAATGTDASVSWDITTKGSGSAINLNPGGTRQFQVTYTASAVNWAAATGGATGTNPSWTATGSDSNIGFQFTVKNTGVFTVTGAASISGHVTLEGVTSTGATGTGLLVFATAPTLTTLTVSSGGATITGLTAVTGAITATTSMAATTTITAGTGLTVTTGGATITGNSTITGSLGGLTGLTVASGGASVTGTLAVTGGITASTSIAATTTITAGTGLTVTTGGAAVLAGGMRVAGTVASITFASTFLADNTGSTSRLISTGADASTIGGFTFHGNKSDGTSFTVLATLSNAGALTLPSNLTVTGGTVTTGASTALSLATTGGTQAKISNTASAVNWANITGAATGSGPTLSVSGSDSNAALNVASLGTGAVNIFTNATVQQFAILHTASATNYGTLKGANSAEPQLGVAGSSTDMGWVFASKGTGDFSFYTENVNSRQVRIIHVASAVNYHNLVGAATGSGPTISTLGSDSNAPMTIKSLGTGVIDLFVNTVRQVQIANSTTAVNYLVLQGRATGNGPIISVGGSDATAALLILSKGANSILHQTGGGVQFVTFSTASAVNYFQVSGNATGSATTVQALGSDTDVSLTVSAKGAGGIGFYTSAVSLQQFRVTHTASAVNYHQFTGNATGSHPRWSAQGSDASIALQMSSKAFFNVDIFGNNFGVTIASFIPVSSAVNYAAVTNSVTGSGVSIGVAAASSDSNVDLIFAVKGSGLVRVNGSSSWTANGAVVTTLTGVGPTGANTTVQEWLTFKNASGTTRYIPAF